jgi:uracil-DNA glycosylase family 4
MKEREKCPICDDLLVSPMGPEDSPVLLVGAYPGWEEVMSGIPWSGKAGEVLKSELARAGINYGTCRVTNLWLHQEVDRKEPHYSREVDYHMARLFKELGRATAVLLMGRQPVSRLLDTAISDVESLDVAGSGLLPSSVKICVVAKNPAICVTDGAVVGNVRHAIERFAKLTREIR